MFCRPIASQLSCLVAALLFAGCQPADDDVLLIGMEGPADSFSVDEENLGMRIVIEQVNATGGIHGRKLVERSYPRGAESPREQAIANAVRLVEEDDVFLLFNFGGPSSVPIGNYAMARKVPHLFPHTALLTLDGARYVFTSYPRYQGESAVMLRYLATERGAEHIAVVHDPNVYGTYFRDRAEALADELGYTFVGGVPVDSSQPQDLTPQIQALKELAPDAVIMALYPAQAKKVMEAKAALEWDDVRFVSSGPLTDEQYLEVPGGHSEGTLGFCHFPDPAEAEGPGFDEYREWMATYRPGHPLNRYSLYGYVFGKLVVEGLRRAGPNPTRESFIDAMESIEDWDSGGVLPPVSFSAENHHAQRAGFICELKSGRFELLTSWIEP